MERKIGRDITGPINVADAVAILKKSYNLDDSLDMFAKKDGTDVAFPEGISKEQTVRDVALVMIDHLNTTSKMKGSFHIKPVVSYEAAVANPAASPYLKQNWWAVLLL